MKESYGSVLDAKLWKKDRNKPGTYLNVLYEFEAVHTLQKE